MKFTNYTDDNKKIIQYNQDQRFCVDCNKPINKNCYNSKKMESKCGKCFKMNFRENEKREKSKNITKTRKNQRKYKYESY